MEPTQSSVSESKYWLPVFLLVPLICMMQFGNAYTADKGMKVLYSALAGGVGGLLGFAGYYFTINRPAAFRVLVLVIVAVVTALPTILLPTASAVASNNNTNYSTCPVCGYVAYKANEKACDNCGEELTAEEMRQSGLTDVDSLIQLDQAFYFIPDDEKAPITFNQPDISEDGYKLDKSWKPSVSEAAVRAQATHYYEFQKRNPVKVRVIKKE
ncbi:hypothetical protein [Hymenobacter terrigena]